MWHCISFRYETSTPYFGGRNVRDLQVIQILTLIKYRTYIFILATKSNNEWIEQKIYCT